MNTEEEEREIMIDDEWVNEYKETEAVYNLFYKSEVNTVDLIFYYINENRGGNEQKTKKEQIKLVEKTDEHGYIKKIVEKETLKKIVDTNKEKYRLIAIYKYNILIDPENIIFENADSLINELYFSKVSSSCKEDIVFEKTIGYFQDLNALYLIYKKINAKTKKKQHYSHERQNTKTRKNKLKNII